MPINAVPPFPIACPHLMKNSRLIFLLTALLPGLALANSAPEQGPPVKQQPSTANPVPPPPDCIPCEEEPVDPVVLSGGKLYYPAVDVEVPGLGRAFNMNLRFFRGYSSQDNTVGVLGLGWSTTLDIYLGNTGGAVPWFHSETGNIMYFQPTTVTFHDGHIGPGWVDRGHTLEVVAAGDYEMVRKNGVKHRFTSVGQLRYIEDPLGHRPTYNRNGLGQVTTITDSSGRSLSFTYTFDGKLESMTDPLLRVWGYVYHVPGVWGAGMLAGVTGPAPLFLTERYYYAADGNMLSLKNARGNITYYEHDLFSDRVLKMIHPGGSFVQFTYNNFLGTSAMTDEDGKIWQYEYEGPGLVKNVIDPLNAVHHYKYNNSHELVEYNGPLYNPVTAPNRKYNYTWINNNMTQIVDETGTVKDFTYDANTHEILSETITLASGNRTVTLTKDGFRRVQNVQDALTKNTSYTYDVLTDLVKTITDRRNHVTTFNYDAHGNTTSVVDANNQTWNFTYDAVGRLLTRSTPIAGTTITYRYDVANRIDRVTDPLNKFWYFSYDTMGNLLSEQTPLANTTTTYTYDSRDRLQTTKDPLNNTTTYGYNGRSLLTSVTDALNRVTNYDYDATGRRTKITQPPSAPGGAAIVTEFVYNLAGELTSVKDAQNKVTQFHWDPSSRRTTTTFPNTTTEISDYNEAGELVSFTNRSVQTQTRAYNANGWLLTKNCPTCGSSFTYDDEGNLQQVIDANTGTYSWTYDNLNRALTSVQPGGTTGGLKTVSYTYDNAGRPLTMTYPDNTTLTYSYNSRSLLSNIASSTLGNFGFSYDDARRRTGLTFPNSHTGAYTYDTVSRPTGVTWNTATPSLIASQTNVWNSVGNISSSTTTHGLTGTRTYGYDQNNRLTTRTTSGSLNSPHPALTWNLDVVGNRTSTVLNGVTTSYSLNGAQLNQYGTIGGASQTWDTRGNLLTDGTRSLTYDADNRLIQAVSGAATCTYTYDFAHRMASRLETGGSQIRMIYDQNWNVIATISGANGSILQKFIHGPQVDELLAQVGWTSSSTYYLTKDHLGSTTAIVRASTNTITERYTYDEYGAVQVWDTNNQPVSTTPFTRTLFTGREYQPATGLYHYRHRWYHPGIGRFVSPDPIGFEGGDVNWYGYVRNAPSKFIDPLGLQVSIKGVPVQIAKAIEAGSPEAVEALGGTCDMIAKANKISHLFNNARHGLDSLVRASGGKTKLLDEITKLFCKAAKDLPKGPTGPIKLNVGGTEVTASGSVTSAGPQLGTAYIPSIP